jgi:hypothetical protein
VSVGSATNQTFASEMTSPLVLTTVTSKVVGGVSLHETKKNTVEIIDRNAMMPI